LLRSGFLGLKIGFGANDMWTIIRVGAYACLPVAAIGLAAAFPGYVSYASDTQRITVSATVGELSLFLGGAGGAIAGIFAKWGKR